MRESRAAFDTAFLAPETGCVSLLHVRVTPRASSNAIVGFDDTGCLKLRVTAPPADGAANAAVARLLAKALGVPPRDIILVRGATSREKHFDVPLPEAELHTRLSR